MFQFLVLMLPLAALIAYIIRDMARYAPGEKRMLDLERRARVHVRSHDYKIGKR